MVKPSFEVRMKEIIQSIDTHAFVAINDVTDSMSKNLRYSRFHKKRKPTETLSATATATSDTPTIEPTEDNQ